MAWEWAKNKRRTWVFGNFVGAEQFEIIPSGLTNSQDHMYKIFALPFALISCCEAHVDPHQRLRQRLGRCRVCVCDFTGEV
jgi:hypothetical protein